MRHTPELSLALSAVPRADGTEPRAAIERAAAIGYRAVQLDATAPGLRPRELDRSARRGVAALLRRLGLGLSGLDLLIPPAEFRQRATMDRALAAALAAVELASDLSRLASGTPVVCVDLPQDPNPEVEAALRERAAALGARVADLVWPARAAAPGDPVGIGIDPARVLLAEGDPAAAAAKAGAGLVCARWSDTDGGARIAPLRTTRRGRLDDLAYRVALGTAGYSGAVVLDLRTVPSWEAVAADALETWRSLP